MRGKDELRLLIVFSTALSLAVLAGPVSSDFHLPSLQLAHANLEFGGPPPCPARTASGACSWYLLPAGPEMNTELATIFTDQTAEYANLVSASPSIDFTDSPCPPSVCQTLINSSNFLVTNPVAQVGYAEIEFNLANIYWGCTFSFGNSACGVQLRQGLAHMIDKTSFTANDPNLSGMASPIDNPVPTTSIGNLPSPNPCAYDASFPESGTQCVVGANGGVAYHIQAATGADGFAWLPAPGSPDLNAAAQHFVNAGLATGFNLTTSVLTGISSAASASGNVPVFAIRNDDSVRLDLGNSLAAEVCYLFTGSYAAPCNYLSIVRGTASSFSCIGTGGSCCPSFGLGTCVNAAVNTFWWMYTAAFSGPTFFDGSLYFGYNSRFVSGDPSIQQPNGPCSAQALPSNSPSDYMYVCSPSYDSLSSQMEFAPCLSATGDPSPGSLNNGPGADCTGTSKLSAISAGVQAEAIFGAGAFTLPIFERTVEFGYLNNGWTRDINSNDAGLPNYFTWLNVQNPAPPLAGTIRQGFSENTKSVNPYIASTAWDTYIVGNVYDSLHMPNPLDPAQSIDWMTIGTQQVSNSSLTYTAPPHTVTTYRFALRSDLYFQDGRPVTSYDVAFSYLSMIGTGAFAGSQVSSMTGITVLGPHQFDIGVSSLGPFTVPNLTSVPIVPARYWTNAGSTAWDNAAMTCGSGASCSVSQYTLSGSTVNCTLRCSPFSASLLTINPAQVTASFDPIANHIFIGSGPFECGIVTSVASGTCTSTGAQNPGISGNYALTRFGNGLAPASSVTGIYFRSSGDLALSIWSGMNGGSSDFINFTVVASCFGAAVASTGSCTRFQQGIGAPTGGGMVGAIQIGIVSRFYGVNWVAPFSWTSLQGIGSVTPVLYEGSATLNPASTAGCTSAFPTGGYDC